MPLPTLESLTSGLDRACADVLGEEIQYAANGAAYAAVRAHVDYRDAAKAFEGAQAIAQDIVVTFLKADVPTKPASAARLTLARRAGKTFKPVSPRTDESGTHWEMEVAEVASA